MGVFQVGIIALFMAFYAGFSACKTFVSLALLGEAG